MHAEIENVSELIQSEPLLDELKVYEEKKFERHLEDYMDKIN